MSDLLLEWMSFRGNGRVDELPPGMAGPQPRRVLRDMSTFGHVELTGPATWRIAPPTLAALPETAGAEPTVIFCGARTPSLTRKLNAACLSTRASIRTVQGADFPSSILVSAPSFSLLADTAEQASLVFQYNAAYSILSCVPSIGRWPRQSCQMVGGRVETIKRFSGSRALWVSSTLAEAESATHGFFRIKRDWDWVSIFKSSQNDCCYIDDRAGRFLAAAKRRHVTWSADTNILGLPTNLFPPVLIARAFVLCSGMAPKFEGGRVFFAGVNAEMLRLSLSITGLRLA